VDGQARHQARRQPRPAVRAGVGEEALPAQGRELLPQEAHEQTADVVPALAQGRQPDLEAAQAMQQRRPEPSLGDGGLEVGVGGGHDADVDPQRRLGPHRLDLAALQSAQQEDLHLQRRLADFVQEQRAGVGALEVARPPPVGPGKGAARRAEELRGGERRGNRAQVEREIGPVPAWSGGVNGHGHELLAGAGLAAQQDRRGHRRDPPDLAAQEDHGGAVAGQAEALGLARQDGRQEVEEQRHAIGEQDDDAAFDFGGRDLVLRTSPEEIDPAAAGLRCEPDRARLIAGGEVDRAPAQMGIGQRTRALLAGLCEQWRETR
jgi:hypothetical protein